MDKIWVDTQKVLALGVVAAFVGVIVTLIFHGLPEDTATSAMINTLAGGLGTMAVAVVTFYFGSSKGSTDKDVARDNTLNTLVNKVVQNGDGHAPTPEVKP